MKFGAIISCEVPGSFWLKGHVYLWNHWDIWRSLCHVTIWLGTTVETRDSNMKVLLGCLLEIPQQLRTHPWSPKQNSNKIDVLLTNQSCQLFANSTKDLPEIHHNPIWPNGIIFHQPRFPWNKGSHFPYSTTIWGPRDPCEVAISFDQTHSSKKGIDRINLPTLPLRFARPRWLETSKKNSIPIGGF